MSRGLTPHPLHGSSDHRREWLLPRADAPIPDAVWCGLAFVSAWPHTEISFATSGQSPHIRNRSGWYTPEGPGSDRWPYRPASSATDPTRCSISHDSTPPSVTRWTRSFKTPPCAACHGHCRQIFGHHQLVPQLMAHMTVPVPAHPHQLPTRACDLFQGLLPPHRFRQQSAAQRLEFVLAERCGAR